MTLRMRIEAGNAETQEWELLPDVIELVPYPFSPSEAQDRMPTMSHFTVDWWCQNYELIIQDGTKLDIHVAYGSTERMVSIMAKEDSKRILHVIGSTVGSGEQPLTVVFQTRATDIPVNLICDSSEIAR